MRTICDAMNQVLSTKDLFSEVHHLLQFFLTVPVTTATSERTFSSLRRVKSYLRTTMTQERLNHLLLLYCHKARTDNLDMTKMANSLSANDRRAMFFWFSCCVMIIVFILFYLQHTFTNNYFAGS